MEVVVNRELRRSTAGRSTRHIELYVRSASVCSAIATIDALMAAHIGPLNTLNIILLLHYYT